MKVLKHYSFLVIATILFSTYMVILITIFKIFHK